MKHRFPLSDCVLVVVCDEFGNRFHSENMHRYAPSYVVSRIEDYANWKYHRKDLRARVIGHYDSSSADKYFGSDWDVRNFLY